MVVIFPNAKIKSIPFLLGEAVYTTPGTYSWTAPTGVTRVCAVCIGGGGGIGGDLNGLAGDGGGLGWKNNIVVVPGNSYTVVVGGPEGASYFINTSTVAGYGGSSTGLALSGGTYVGDGGGIGGTSGADSGSVYGGGGGAGGYTGGGGLGGGVVSGAQSAGSGGGGGGGETYDTSGAGGTYYNSGGGGGVGLYGQGSNGAAGGSGGGGGSGGLGGMPSGSAFSINSGTYSVYGGGRPRAYRSVDGRNMYSGGSGAVRIVWGNNVAFPSTNVGPLQ